VSAGAEAAPLARALRWALGPVSSVRLAAFRLASAFALMVYTLTWALDAREWLTPAGYHMSVEVSRGLQLPVPLLGSASVVVFLVVYVGAMVAIVLDWRPRAASVVVLLGLIYVTFADRLAAFSMNKLAIVAWLVLVLAPWPGPRAEDEPDDGDSQLRSAWPLRILQGTLLLQYLGAGICKLRGDWPGNPQALWLQVQDVYMTQLAAWMVRELPMWVWAGLQHGALAFELLAPILFCVRRLRPLAFVWGLGMHLMIGLTMHRVGLFSLSVVTYYVLFADEARLIALRRRLAPDE
jgi:hypothetical protein